MRASAQLTRLKVLRNLLHSAIILALGLLETSGQPSVTWGPATNGLRLGIDMAKTWHTKQQYALLCIIDIQNVGTNKHVFIKAAPLESRYAIKLYGPQGEPVEIVPGGLASIHHFFQHGGTLRTNENDDLDDFFITDIFEVKTNGLHTLVFSERLTTKETPPKPSFPLSLFYEPLKPTNYFLMPVVTNTFDISQDDLEGVRSMVPPPLDHTNSVIERGNP